MSQPPSHGGPPGGPYGPPGGPNPGPYGWGPSYPPPEHGDATTVLLLGVLSLAICPILGPFAWAKGNDALRDIASNPGGIGGEGTVKAGRICGILGTVYLALLVLFLIGLLAIPLAFWV